MKVLEVRLWGERVGALGWDAGRGTARFQYDADFLRAGLHLSPLRLAASRQIQQFPELARSSSFLGLPGFIADSLPGKFGNQVLQAWLAVQGRQLLALNPLERLSLVGARGTGALEYFPDAQAPQRNVAIPLHVGELLATAAKVAADEHGLDATELEPLFTSGLVPGEAGVLVGWHPQSGQFLSGQASLPNGFEHWQLKVDGNVEPALRGQAGRLEYACHEMAHAAGINSMECRLHLEGKQACFMSRRFDRVDGNSKVHVLTFAGLAHADPEPAGACSYEQLFQAIRELQLGQEALNEMYRRMLFNICARNLHDHATSHAFLMFGDGQWQLAPARNLRFSSQAANRAVTGQQMTCNGKRDNFTLEDLLSAARAADVKRPLLQLERVQEAIARWPEFAGKAGLSEKLTVEAGLQHRLFIESNQVAKATNDGPAQGSLF